jgi:hypothetical protein
MRFFCIVFLLFITQIRTSAQSNTPDASTWVTNGRVNCIVADGSTVYLGGAFTHVGPIVPYGIALSTTDTTGLPNTAYAKPNGTVRAVASDGSGGWYIGGDFTTVGGVTRKRLARINSDGSLHDWNPDIFNNGVVNAIAVSGSTVYVGGSFTIAGSSLRNRIAALNADATGSTAADGSPYLTSWNPNANNTVNTIAVSGGTVYIGGYFTTVAGTARNRIAALYNTTAVAAGSRYYASWNPNVSSTGAYINAIAVSGGTVYIGGSFSTVAGTTRNRMAALYDTAAVAAGSPYLASWNPNVSASSVNAIAVSGSKVYIGGGFTSVANTAQNFIAALNDTATVAAGSSILTNWNPNSDGTVSSLLVSGTTVYAGGDFANIGGKARPRIAALDAGTGSATSWNPKSGGAVLALANHGDNLYAGGSFTIIGGEVRNRLAAIDASTGQANAWNPNAANNTVNAILLSGGVLYAGGTFTTVGGLTRNYIAAIDPATGTVTGWNPNPDNDIAALAASGDTIYAGGNFTTIGGKTRNKLASLSASDGTAFSWNPNVNLKVNAIAVSGGKVYFGGQFTAVNNGIARNYLARVNTSDSILTSWNPNPSISSGTVEVFAVAVYNGMVYAAGNFTSIGDSSRKCFAGLRASTGKSTAWNPGVNNTVSALAISGSMVYAVRSFASAGGVSRTNLAGLYLNVNTNNATPWNPTPDGYLYAVAVSNDKVFIGGEFNKVNSEVRSNFAAFPITSVNWGGSTGGDWNDASNWAPGIVPTSSLDVSVSMGRPSLNQDYTLPSGKTLTLSGTGSLTVAAGKRLTVAGTANFGSRPVTFKSAATGTSSLGTVTGSLSNADSVTVERYIPAGRKWRFLCAPLTGSSNNSVFYNWQNNDVPNGSTGVEIWGPGGSSNPSSNAPNNGLALGGSASMLSFSSGWQSVTNTNNTYLFDGTTNNAFALFLTGPYNNGSTAYIGSQGNLPAGVATTLSATGSLITGDHTKSLTAASAGDYLLVANPYASPVDPSSFTASGTANRTNLDNILYMWDAKQGGTNGVGRYVSFDIEGNAYSLDGGAGTGYESGTMIQSGQAFFVRATAAGPASLVFRESSKSASSSSAMMGNSTRAARSTVRIQLEQDGVAVDGAMAFFHAGASASVDAMDGVKMPNGSDNLGLRREGRTLVFEHRPELTSVDTLPVILSQMQRRTHMLRIVSSGMAAKDGFRLELVDRYTQQRLELVPNDTTRLEFTVDADEASTGERFLIVMSKSAPPTGTALEPTTPGVRPRPYPNPLTGAHPLRVDLDPERAPWSLRLLDATGRTLWMRNGLDATERTVEIDMSAQAAGLYHLEATDGRGSRSVSKVLRQ